MAWTEQDVPGPWRFLINRFTWGTNCDGIDIEQDPCASAYGGGRSARLMADDGTRHAVQRGRSMQVGWPLHPGVPVHAVSLKAPRLLSCRLESKSSNSPVEKGEVFEWQQRPR
jgi:hypothetical protein